MKTILSIFMTLIMIVTARAVTPLSQFENSLLETAEFVFALPQNEAGSISQSAVSNTNAKPKNRGKAMFMSLLLPGLGQRYAEAKTKGTVFFGVEIGLWLTYAGLTSYGNWRQNDYETYAATHAGVNLAGKNNTFFIDVGNFDNIYDHNDYRLRQRNFNKYYEDTDYWFWQWDSKASMETFDELRISADTADNRAKFVLGAIVANHIISAIDAVWSVHQYEKKNFSNIDWDLQFGDGIVQPTVNLNMTAHF